MPTIQGDIVRITAKGVAADGSAIENTFHCSVINAAPQTDAALAVAAQEYIEDIYSSLVGVLSEEFLTTTINVFILRGSQALGEFVWPTITGGTQTGDQLPNQNCALGSMATGVSRRVGRKYWGPMSETDCVDGIFSAGVVSAVLAAMAKVGANFVASNNVGLTGVVYDRVADIGRGVVSVTASAIPAIQRRRRSGQGA